jgi:outer membrane PBP1 activator LpoA protein
MLPAPRMLRLAFLLLAAWALGGCPSLVERGGPPPSLDRATALEAQGDEAGAARVYEDLAGQNSGADRNGYLLHAARAYLAARRTDDAARVLASTESPLSAEQLAERSRLKAQLAREQAAAHTAAAAPLADHGAANTVEYEAHIALLLPVTGRAAASAISVREGFMTAFYQTPVAQRVPVRVYDTGVVSVTDALNAAIRAGAEFIVGPLTREEVTAAADTPARHVPLLALNFLPAEHVAPAQFYQYALSPEDEARLVAQRVLQDHHARGVAIVPAGDWGTRVLSAFRQELTAGGGELIGSEMIDAARTDFSSSITSLLRISDSTARARRLEAVLGTKLVFEPRRRADIGFIFAPAQANIERLLRPQLRFHYAGDIATYATSDAFEPDPRANEDLEGLMFPDMPWLLGGDLADAVRSAAHDAWPSGGPHRGRLFAFGFDAYRLAVALRNPGVAANLSIEGLTGRLSLDAERHVRRELVWAQLHNGELHLLPAAAQQSE